MELLYGYVNRADKFRTLTLVHARNLRRRCLVDRRAGDVLDDLRILYARSADAAHSSTNMGAL